MAATLAAALLAALLVLASAGAEAAGVLGAAALRQRHSTLAPQLADNPFGGPIHLESQEASRRLEGDVYAVLEHPFARVRAALEDAGQWCDVMILHLNTKHCRRTEERGATAHRGGPCHLQRPPTGDIRQCLRRHQASCAESGKPGCHLGRASSPRDITFLWCGYLRGTLRAQSQSPADIPRPEHDDAAEDDLSSGDGLHEAVDGEQLRLRAAVLLGRGNRVCAAGERVRRYDRNRAAAGDGLANEAVAVVKADRRARGNAPARSPRCRGRARGCRGGRVP